MEPLDVIIVGGGPIGIACGLEAKKKGLRYLILEKGCIVNSLYNYPLTMQFFSSSDKLEIAQIPFISKEAKPKRDEALEYYRRIVSSSQLHINLFEKVETVVPKEGVFTVRTSKAAYKSTSVIIATGFYDIPNTMGIPGEGMEKVSHYYREPHFYSHQKLAVIGASNSAIDAALECYRKGATVSLIIRGPEVGQRVKYWVRPDIINRIEEGSIRAYYNTEVKEIKEGHLTIQNKDGIQELENDYVLALTGYRPNFKFLSAMGINLTKDEKMIPQYDPGTMETNVEGLYLAGVICGGMETHKWFIENSLVHAEIIMASILQKSSR